MFLFYVHDFNTNNNSSSEVLISQSCITLARPCVLVRCLLADTNISQQVMLVFCHLWSISLYCHRLCSCEPYFSEVQPPVSTYVNSPFDAVM